MCGRFSGVVHEVATAVSTDEKAGLRKLLRKNGARDEFLRRFGASGASNSEFERILRDGDMVTFFAHLVVEGPAMRVEWEVRDRTDLSYERSSVALYVYAGVWFVSVNGSRLSTEATYSTPRKAIEKHEGHLKYEKDGWYRPSCGVYRSARSAEGLKLISAGTADEIVSKLTSLNSPINHGVFTLSMLVT